MLSGLKEEDLDAAEGQHWSEVFDGLEYKRGFRRRYQISILIGKGLSAEVFTCKDQVTGVVYAVKVFDTGNAFAAQRNVTFMRDFNHPNIIRMVDLFAPDETDKIHLVMEIVTGGELFDYIIMEKKISETRTRKIFLQLLSALDFIVSADPNPNT